MNLDVFAVIPSEIIIDILSRLSVNCNHIDGNEVEYYRIKSTEDRIETKPYRIIASSALLNNFHYNEGAFVNENLHWLTLA
ncbi:hypothetical protein ACS0TY_028200 [Phlomoides rotata]